MNYISKISKGIYEELGYNFLKSSFGRDPFEWIHNKRLRGLYWDLFLSNRMPSAVEFEMNSYCNRRCSYCPNHFTQPKTEHFDFNLYKDLINELSTLNYHGEITPNFYGEPLLDKRIYDFIAYAREKLPHAFIIVNTNADYLGIKEFQRLMEAGVSPFDIAQPSENILNLKEFLKENTEYQGKVIIRNMTKEIRTLSSRGGLISDKRVKYAEKRGCFRSRRVTLTYNGDMIMCCEDYHRSFIFGNIKQDGLMNIWKKSLKLRREIFLGHYAIPICRKCAGFEAS
ncbi:MAG: SPASM domain-containing protein [Nitrospirae bacterium]|nr:SPASM domain-containing protein [Nitrospirota bacterium]